MKSTIKIGCSTPNPSRGPRPKSNPLWFAHLARACRLGVLDHELAAEKIGGFSGWDSETIRNVQQPLRKKNVSMQHQNILGFIHVATQKRDPVRQTNRKQESSRMILSTKNVVHCSFGSRISSLRGDPPCLCSRFSTKMDTKTNFLAKSTPGDAETKPFAKGHWSWIVSSNKDSKIRSEDRGCGRSEGWTPVLNRWCPTVKAWRHDFICAMYDIHVYIYIYIISVCVCLRACQTQTTPPKKKQQYIYYQ